jgi:hypothetical protein
MPDRFSEVEKGKLYRGGKPSPNELVIFRNNFGINKIISLDQESGDIINPFCKALGLNHIIWGLGDGDDPKIIALKKRIIPSLNLGGPTYVHCYHGKDRTGMCIAMYRLFQGWGLDNALEEAYKFGMGLGLGKDVRNSYYRAVIEYSKELGEDNNDNKDIVSLMRENNPIGPPGPVYVGNSFCPPHREPGESITAIASQNRIYCKCNYSKLLRPNMVWWTTKELAEKNSSDGSLFSAQIDSSAIIDNIDKNFNKELLYKLLLNNNCDIIKFRSGQIIVINPDILVNIQEEYDINNMIDVGLHDNSTSNLTLFPGSGSGIGGMPAGAAGFVRLPYSGSGQI